MNAIQLVRTSQGYMARFTGPHAGRIVELFGSDTIPTPFTARANPETVRDEIMRRNPGVLVSLA